MISHGWEHQSERTYSPWVKFATYFFFLYLNSRLDLNRELIHAMRSRYGRVLYRFELSAYCTYCFVSVGVGLGIGELSCTSLRLYLQYCTRWILKWWSLEFYFSSHTLTHFSPSSSFYLFFVSFFSFLMKPVGEDGAGIGQCTYLKDSRIWFKSTHLKVIDTHFFFDS